MPPGYSGTPLARNLASRTTPWFCRYRETQSTGWFGRHVTPPVEVSHFGQQSFQKIRGRPANAVSDSDLVKSRRHQQRDVDEVQCHPRGARRAASGWTRVASSHPSRSTATRILSSSSDASGYRSLRLNQVNCCPARHAALSWAAISTGCIRRHASNRRAAMSGVVSLLVSGLCVSATRAL